LASDSAGELYRQLLVTEAGGDRRQALEQLIRQTRCAWDAGGVTWDTWQWVAVNWTKELAGVCSRSCLMPLVTLHQDLVASLAVAGQQQISWEARQILGRLLRKISALPQETADASTVARLHARMGLLDRDLGFLDLARKELVTAVSLQPASIPILHALATLDEKRGEYSTARHYLERLTQLDPEDEIAGLRLALTELRLGKEREALERLSSLSAAAKKPWVAELACQELAQALAEQGRKPEALEVLQNCRQRFPVSATLALQWAYWSGEALPPLGADSQAEEEAETEDGDRILTARASYNQWPEAELIPLAQAFGEDLEQGRLDLERGLRVLYLRQLP
jgi:tetratricopeptide (TPR) repeat protein